jgi:hypothetical protein
MFIFSFRRQMLKRLGEESNKKNLLKNKGTYSSEIEIRSICSDGTGKIPEASPLMELIVEQCEDNNSLVIDNTSGQLDINRIQENKPEGRCIVNFSFVWDEIHRIFDNHAKGIECHFRDWKLIGYRRRGLLTQLFFKCQMYNYEDNIWSEPINFQELDINKAAVFGTITMGIGYAQLKELCAAMNITCMSEPTYIKIRDILVEDFQKTAMENMKKAGKAEKQLALERNDIINGYGVTTVIVDGSWMKRQWHMAILTTLLPEWQP